MSLIGKEYSPLLLVLSLLHAIMHAFHPWVFSFPPLGDSLWWDLRHSQINVHLCCPEVGAFCHLFLSEWRISSHPILLIGKEYSPLLLVLSPLHALMHEHFLLVLSFSPLGASLWWDLRASQINAHLCCPEIGLALSLSFSRCQLHLPHDLFEVGIHVGCHLFRSLPLWDV